MPTRVRRRCNETPIPSREHDAKYSRVRRLMFPAARRHVAALAICVAAVAWWFYPVLTRMSEAVPGAGAGDNVSFVWNVWWTRYALHHSGQSVFFSPPLLHPFGANLSQHTLTLLPALTVSWIANPVLAQNVLIVGHILLNFRLDVRPRLQGDPTLPGVAPRRHRLRLVAVRSAHLQGHFNLIAAWVIPLTALAVAVGCDNPSWRRGVPSES